MPGETLEDALGAAEALRSKKIGAVFTHLGENIKDRAEALQVAELLSRSAEEHQRKGFASGDFRKLTQLGLDLSPICGFEYLNASSSAQKGFHCLVDMEASNYVDATTGSLSPRLTAHPTWRMPAGVPPSNKG